MIQYLTKQEGVKIIVDYFTCTFPLKVHEDQLEVKIVDDLVHVISEFLGFSNEEIVKEEFATNRYKYQYTLGESVTIRLGGPELLTGYKSSQIELRGQGCREIEAHTSKNWIEIFTFFTLILQGSPTRLDIAIDDYEGKYCKQETIKETLDKGNYITSFRNKDYTLHGNEKNGWSIQFGSHKSTQMLVIYDKLKEQITKGNSIEQTFWTRYEMRFMKEKAYDVVLNYIENKIENFNKYSYGLLYSMLDLKEDNNYNEHHIREAKTIKYWSDFLTNVSKADIGKYKINIKNLETYKNWIIPIISSYFIIMYLHNYKDFMVTYVSMLEPILEYLEKFDKKKIKNVNKYQKEVGQPLIGFKDIISIKDAIRNYIAINQLPF